ncbi:MAG: hypothetical protein WAN93_07580 [Solirubrobacteraceae bacterium]
MSTITSPTLTIACTGERVRVDPKQITENLLVPNLGRDDPLAADDQPGKVSAELFTEAESAKAVLILDGLIVDCYGDDDGDGGGFILVAYPAADRRAGVTCGWRDAKNLARNSGDDRDDNDPVVVKEALEFMAAEINSALNAKYKGNR